jgi:hypothetical protein
VFSNVISDLFSQTKTKTHTREFINTQLETCFGSSHIDMVHLVSAYIMGSHTVYKPLFILK